MFSPHPSNWKISKLLKSNFAISWRLRLKTSQLHCQSYMLHLWALPSLKRVGCVVPALRSLRVGECPMLVNVISSSQLPQNLEILHIKFCDQLETVIENRASMSHTSRKLHTLHMWELPELKSIGAELLPL